MSKARTRKVVIDRPGLGKSAAAAYELFLKTPPWKAWKLRDLLTGLAFQGIRISPDAWYKRVLSRLERWGLRHDRGVGYYLPMDVRPYPWVPDQKKQVDPQVGAIPAARD